MPGNTVISPAPSNTGDSLAAIAEAAAAAADERVRSLDELLAKDIGDMVSLTIGIGKQLQARASESWRALFAGERIKVEEIGKELTNDFNRILGQFLNREAWIKESERRGYKIEGADEFRRVHNKLSSLADDFNKRWPRFDPVALQQAVERTERGEFLTAAEFRDALLRDD